MRNKVRGSGVRVISGKAESDKAEKRKSGLNKARETELVRSRLWRSGVGLSGHSI
ncbi:hypothetical protein PAXRUDRAFT_550398 [Paxillus rubicundulus Ve08.2h10]|uniref:Uncharacterized protein n=1 Tax=Paxillus rubicundulus Ve08.2h10 TaxID=930991 RepID=A0A0D0CG53_9AGAM|nr:hypothetical protein PAXRUDRAFT_550398 [Paxillus rubicundulus Ve08.2h10]